MSVTTVGAVLFLSAAIFAVLGILYARSQGGTLEEYITARRNIGGWGSVSTLVASALGAWVLFGPAEAATWGGISVVLGYAIGSGAVRFVYIPLGRRMRDVMPEGHSLTEFLWHRFGRVVYLMALLAMLFYMFIFLTAELTAMARLVALIADIPLWLTAAVVMATTLAYTVYGGLRASIFTDAVQLAIILPILLGLLVVGWIAVGGASGLSTGLAEKAPHLADITYRPGWEGGIALFLAVMLTNMFHQGYWQRVFAARDEPTMSRSFLIAGLIAGLFVFALGLFGLAFKATGQEGPASAAVFAVLFDVLPTWLTLVLMVAGLALVMSSADTIINAVASIIAVDLERVTPGLGEQRLKSIARWTVVVAAIPVVVVAAQGFSVLYLFLLADLICAAIAFPVFFGLYSRNLDSVSAAVAIVAGLIAGATVFPDPSLKEGSLAGAFLLALCVPVVVCLGSLAVRPAAGFDFGRLRREVRHIPG